MLNMHKHEWRYMYTVNAEYDWFYCMDCLAVCCQKVNLETGKLERTNFEVKSGGKR